MRRESRISIGPGAASLILILVVLSMSILGMLSLITARNDDKLSDRSIEVAKRLYGMNAEAENIYADVCVMAHAAAKEASGQEEYLEKLSAMLPEDIFMDGDEISFTVTDEDRILDCALKVTENDGRPHIEWVRYMLTKEEEEDDSWDW